MSDYTVDTINVALSREVHGWLSEMKVVPGESYDSVVRRVLHESDIGSTPPMVEKARSDDEAR